MKVSHEVPLCMLDESRGFNDYDYALVHLLGMYPEYFDFYKTQVELGRTVFLDNSVFELGTPFDSNDYKCWIDKLKPTHAVIPDRFLDANFTIQSVINWVPFLQERGVKSIGVVQGKTLSDFERCYCKIASLVDVVAISFAQPLFAEWYPLENKDFARMYGRLRLINHLASIGALEYDKPHHLLGISLPQELLFYKKKSYAFIHSVDSSSPIVHGLHGIGYSSAGLTGKCDKKMADLMEIDWDQVMSHAPTILDNINIFKQFAS